MTQVTILPKNKGRVVFATVGRIETVAGETRK